MKNLLNKIKIFFLSIFYKKKEVTQQDKFKYQFKNEKDYYDSWNKDINLSNKTNISIDDFYRVIDKLSNDKKYKIKTKNFLTNNKIKKPTELSGYLPPLGENYFK